MDPVSSRLNFGGLVTGLDTNLLIETLMSLERRPLERIQQRKATIENERSLFQQFNTKLLSLRSALQEVDNRISTLGAESNEEEFLRNTATSEDDDVITVSAGGTASPGVIDVTVNQLATAGYQVSNSYASASDALLTGGKTISIDYGGDENIEITLDGGGASLNDLRDAINLDTSNDNGVTAQVVTNDGDNRLVISGVNAGEDNDLTITGTLIDDGFIDGALIQTAQNAEIEVYGITVERSSNSISDAVEGLTLNLHSTSAPGTPTEVEVSRDVAGTAEGLQGVVDAFNEVHDFVRQHTVFDPETGETGALNGDSAPRNIELQIISALTGAYSFDGNPFRGLAQVGVTFDTDGRLSLDQDALEDALNQDANAVAELLAGDGTAFDGTADGVATRVARILEPITQYGNGFLAERDDGFETRLDLIDDQIERFENLLARREDSLIRRFSSLETTVASLQAQQSFLTGI